MRNPVSIKCPLAEDFIGVLKPSPFESEELLRLCSDKRYLYLTRIIFQLMKLGQRPVKIMALCQIEHRLYERLSGGIKSSTFLKDSINDAIKEKALAVADSAAIATIDGDDIENAIKIESTLIPMMEEKLVMLLDAIDGNAITEASLKDIADAYSKIFDKLRLAQNKTTANIMGVQVLQSTAADDARRLAIIQKQMDDIRKTMEAMPANEPKSTPA